MSVVAVSSSDLFDWALESDDIETDVLFAAFMAAYGFTDAQKSQAVSECCGCVFALIQWHSESRAWKMNGF